MYIQSEHGPELVVERRGLFDPGKHPRGTGAQGGQFVSKGASGNNDTIGYDSKHGTGAGYGARGGDARVKELQRILNNLGLKDREGKPLLVDGKLGPRTTAAIRRLQQRMGLKPDGLVTPALLQKIRAADHQRHLDFKAGKKGTRQAALNGLAAKPHHRRMTVARPAKKATMPKKTPAKRTGR